MGQGKAEGVVKGIGHEGGHDTHFDNRTVYTAHTMNCVISTPTHQIHTLTPELCTQFTRGTVYLGTHTGHDVDEACTVSTLPHHRVDWVGGQHNTQITQ